MSADPALVIPMRIDGAEALAQLKKIAAAGTAAGHDVKAAGEDAGKGLNSAATEAQGFGNELAGISRGTMTLGAVKSVADALNDTMKQASDYVKGVTDGFIETQKQMQQIAALTGKSNSNEFTLEQVSKATKASLSPQEWTSFQEQFQSYGGAYLEGDQSRFVQRGDVSAQDQAEAYQQHIAEFAKGRGINAADAAQLGGGLLQFSTGPQTTEGLEDRFGKVFKTLERAPTPVSQLLPQMSRVMAQGSSPEDAAKLLSIMSEAMPGEEETGVTNTLKAITDQTLKGKGAGLGQKEGMTPLEKVKAATAAIRGRVAKGENLDAVLHEVAPDLREMRGLKGFITRGDEAGGFERVEGYQSETPADFMATSNADFERSARGRRARAEAKRSLGEATVGARNADASTVLVEAEGELAQEGRFDRIEPEDYVRRPMSWVKGTAPKQQLINERAVKLAQDRAGIPQNMRTKLQMGAHQNVANEMINTTLARGKSRGDDGQIVKALEKQTAIAEQQTRVLHEVAAGVKRPAPVLSAPPPGGGGERQ